MTLQLLSIYKRYAIESKLMFKSRYHSIYLARHIDTELCLQLIVKSYSFVGICKRHHFSCVSFFANMTHRVESCKELIRLGLSERAGPMFEAFLAIDRSTGYNELQRQWLVTKIASAPTTIAFRNE